MADRSFLAWPFLDPFHRQLHDRLDAWASENVPDLLPAEETTPAACASVQRLVEAMGAAGLLAPAVGARDGKPFGPLDARALCISREVLARHAGLADFAFAMQGLGTGPISLFGTDEQKQRWLPVVAAGRTLSAFALSEEKAGSDVAAIETRAVRDGEHWRIAGTKKWISNAGIAGLYVVFARTSSEGGSKGMSAFVVEAGTPGFDVPEQADLVSPHPIGSLRFDGARVPAANVLGKPGDGFRIAMATLDVFRATVGAAALGLARRALDEALGHTLGRHLFGQRLSDFQMTRASISDMALAVDAAALLVYRAAWVKDVSGARVSREASMAKLFATEEAQKTIDATVQLFGGLGVTRGHIAERLYREIRALRIYEGASEVQKLIISARTIEQYEADSAVSGERQ